MPAGTQSATTSTVDQDRLMAQTLRQRRVTQRLQPFGEIVCEKIVVSVPATSLESVGDIIELFKFPTGAVLLGYNFYVTDMDTNGAPALVWKVQHDTTDVITGLTAGQTGGALLSASQVASLMFGTVLASATMAEVGGKVLRLNATTGSATAVAGTITGWVAFWLGTTVSLSGS